MPKQPSKKEDEHALWVTHRNEIERLYVAEGKTTEQVRHIMAEKYGFHRK